MFSTEVIEWISYDDVATASLTASALWLTKDGLPLDASLQYNIPKFPIFFQDSLKSKIKN